MSEIPVFAILIVCFVWCLCEGIFDYVIIRKHKRQLKQLCVYFLAKERGVEFSDFSIDQQLAELIVSVSSELDSDPDTEIFTH